MKKTSKVVVIAIIMTLTIQVKVSAAPTYNKAQNQLDQNKDSLKEAKDKREQIEASIEKLDNQIEDYMMKIEESKKRIELSEKDINTTQKQISRLEEEINNRKDAMAKRLKAMYLNGQYNYLGILFESQDFSDLITRIEVIKKIISSDTKAINDLDYKEEVVEIQKKSLEEKHKSLLTLKNENEVKLTNLNNNIADQKKLIQQVKAQEKLFTSKVDESQALVNSTMAEVDKLRNGVPKYALSRGKVIVSSDNVIGYASNFLGIPYLWGGTSPSTGFDCSGFTQYVYGHFGVRLGRTTYDQIKDGYGVAKSELQAGDLVFFGQNGSPTHMGIYAGNNTYIHAPRTGDVIKISSMNRSDYITGRRVK